MSAVTTPGSALASEAVVRFGVSGSLSLNEKFRNLFHRPVGLKVLENHLRAYAAAGIEKGNTGQNFSEPNTLKKGVA